jgi:hypothetical protein
MDIRQYLEFHRFAIEKQYEIILEYQKRLKIATQEADVTGAKATDRAVEYVAAEADPDEVFMERDIRLRYDWMLSAHQESVVYRLKLQEIEQHESGINQLCGLILQSAKQGISTVHGAAR